jgi:hypothetical protein
LAGHRSSWNAEQARWRRRGGVPLLFWFWKEEDTGNSRLERATPGVIFVVKILI